MSVVQYSNIRFACMFLQKSYKPIIALQNQLHLLSNDLAALYLFNDSGILDIANKLK